MAARKRADPASLFAKERGQARLPDPETLALSDYINVEGPSRLRSQLNQNQLRVGKVGLAPTPEPSWFRRSDVIFQQLLRSYSRTDHCEFLPAIVSTKDADNLRLLVVDRTT